MKHEVRIMKLVSHFQASIHRAYGETGFDTNKHGKDGLIFVFCFLNVETDRA